MSAKSVNEIYVKQKHPHGASDLPSIENINGILSIEKGGTGSATLEQARDKLGIVSYDKAIEDLTNTVEGIKSDLSIAIKCGTASLKPFEIQPGILGIELHSKKDVANIFGMELYDNGGKFYAPNCSCFVANKDINVYPGTLSVISMFNESQENNFGDGIGIILNDPLNKNNIPNHVEVSYTYVYSPPIVTQATLAIYFSDDNSLCFYNREFVDAEYPKVGEVFNGKPVAGVFEFNPEVMPEYPEIGEPGYPERGDIEMPWKTIAQNVLKVDFKDKLSPVSTAFWFKDFMNCTDINVDNLDTSKVVDMTSMFHNCNSLTSLNLADFDVQNVNAMRNMFYDCNSLSVIYATRWRDHVRLLDEGYNMFKGCVNLTGGNGTTYQEYSTNISRATIDMQYNEGYFTKIPAFAVYSSDDNSFNIYRRLDIPIAGEQFDGKIASNVFEFDEYDMDNYNGMPWYRTIEESVLKASVKDKMQPYSMDNWFKDFVNCAEIDVSKIDTKYVTSMMGLFERCRMLNSIDLSNFDTSLVFNMSEMFAGCSSFDSLDLSMLNTNNLEMADSMFAECSSLTSLDLSNFDTRNMTRIDSMFYDCSSLTYLDISGFNTKRVTSMRYVFTNCRSLKNLDVSGFDTVFVTDMSGMFSGCDKLMSIDISAFNTRRVESMSSMFSGCDSLTTLDLSRFDTSNVYNMDSMFAGCINLTTIYASDFNIDRVNSDFDMFHLCTKLVGGNGTVYNRLHTRKEYARIDTPPDSPGYFTEKHFDRPKEFAVYSSDDKSLSFYSRNVIPEVGQQFNDKIATEIFEFDIYADFENNIPWATVFQDVLKVCFVDKISPINTAKWFSNFRNCTDIDMLNLDVGYVSNMREMFNGCTSLVNLDLSNFINNIVEDISWMFAECESLTSLDLSGLDARNIRENDYAFYNCSNLKTIYASEDTDMSYRGYGSYMFKGCASIVGGNGTPYREYQYSSSMARIDKAPMIEGYFTEKKQEVKE